MEWRGGGGKTTCRRWANCENPASTEEREKQHLCAAAADADADTDAVQTAAVGGAAAVVADTQLKWAKLNSLPRSLPMD